MQFNENYTLEYYEEYTYWFPIFDFEVALLGYLRPILVILTTLANTFVVTYFLWSRNRGRATSLLFISIAISDTLTGLILLPNSVYVYALKTEDLSLSWCYAYMYLRLYFSRVLHTVSIWQTVLLALQRYICVCYPFYSGRLCTFWKTFIAIVFLYIMSSLLHVYHLVDDKVGGHECRWVTEEPCISACIYIWLCIALMHLAPCFTLIFLTSATLRGLKKAGRRVSTMIPGTGSQRSSRDRIITITTTLVVVVFLIPELPYCAYKLAFVIQKHLGTRFNAWDNHVFLSAYEIALIVSFHSNFWIYCIMMREFRQLLGRVVACAGFKRGLSRLRSMSRSSRSSGAGSTRTSISRTSSVASRQRMLSNKTINYSIHSETAHAMVLLSQSSPASPTSPTVCRYADLPSSEQAEDLIDDVFI